VVGKQWHPNQPNVNEDTAMLRKLKFSLLLLAMPLLTACVSMPTGPSMLVLPGTGKNFDQFRNDDYNCRQYAYAQVGGVTPNQASATSGLASAAIGTALGAAAGAAIGGGQGAAVGAGAGLLAGGMVGSSNARISGYQAQERYDISYVQCMYASGNKVPISGQIRDDSPVSGYPSDGYPSGGGYSGSGYPSMGGYSGGSYPSGGASIPPPPPGTPPPPPPR